MGIHDLLKHMKFSTEKCNITNFDNQTVAVDVSSWIVKASYSCAEQLHAPNGEDVCAPRYTKSIVNRCIELLTFAKLEKIVLVFDGERCPLKASTNAERRRVRAADLQEAYRLKSLGRREEAQDKFRKCTMNTPLMAAHVKRAIKTAFGAKSKFPDGVVCLQAPYEADSQLVKCVVDGVADVVITEGKPATRERAT